MADSRRWTTAAMAEIRPSEASGIPDVPQKLDSVDHFAVLLDEAADVGIRQEIEHRFGGPAELDALRRDDDRPVDRIGCANI